MRRISQYGWSLSAVYAMRSEYRRVVTQASEQDLAHWILKNLDWSGGNDEANAAFVTSILLEHRRQCEQRQSATPDEG